MKKQDIRNLFTQKVTEFLNEGYTIFPDTMGGSQGEIAHIDLTNGSEILRVLLYRSNHWERGEDGYIGETIHLMVGKAGPDTRVYNNWDGTIWNKYLEPRFQIEWAWIGRDTPSEWFTTLEEGRHISKLQFERYKAQHTDRVEVLGDAYKSAALKWLRKQPRMKTCKLEDIEQVQRVWSDFGTRRFEIIAKGKRYTIR